MAKIILDGGKIGKRVLYPMLNFLVVVYFKKIELTSCAVQEKVVSHQLQLPLCLGTD